MQQDVSIKNRITVHHFLLAAMLLSSVLLITTDPYYGHDIGFHLSRIQSIADCLKNHTFPAVIYPNYFSGHGYANGLFYPDLFLYIPGLMVYMGINTKRAYQIFLFLINLVTWLSMYFCIDKIIDDRYTSSLISCIYTLSSYRITDLYERSALGETLCFIFLPLIFLGIYETLYRDPHKGYYMAFGLFGVLSSHIITLLFCVILVFLSFFLWAFRSFQEKKDILERCEYLVLWCGISVFLSAYFLFPFLEAYFSDVYMFKTNPATGGFDRAMPFRFSLIEIPFYKNIYFPMGIDVAFVVLLLLMVIWHRKGMKIDSFSKDVLLLGVIFLIMSTDLFPWVLFKNFAQLIQFPWRFLIIATNAFLFGFAPMLKEYLNSSEKNKTRYTLLMIFCVGFSVLCSAAELYIFRDFKLYHDAVQYSVGGGEYMPSDVDVSLLNDQNNIISNHDIEIDAYRSGTSFTIRYKGNTFKDTYLEFPLIYYKGYQAKENNKKLNVAKGNNSLVRIELNDSQGTVELFYGMTVVRIIGYIISVVFLIALILLIRKTTYKTGLDGSLIWQK